MSLSHRSEESKEEEMLTLSSARESPDISLPAIRVGAVDREREEKQQMATEMQAQEEEQAAAAAAAGAAELQSRRRAMTTAAQQLVQTFDESQLNFARTVESVYHQLKEVLHQTRHSGALSRTRIDGCVHLLQTLAAASPQSSLLTSLVNNLIASIYSLPASSPSPSSLSSLPAYFEQVKLLQRKQQLLFRDLQRISAQVEYYDRNAGGHREALLIAVRKWQRQCVWCAFRQWRQNVRVVGIQRTRLRDVMRGWELRGRRRKLAGCMRQWKMSVLRRDRSELMPRVLEARQRSDELSANITASSLYIEQSQLRLGRLQDDITDLSSQCETVAARVRLLQDRIARYGCFRLSDVAHWVLELVREMLLGLEEELRAGREAWAMDPFRMLYVDSKKGTTAAAGKGKKDKRGGKRKEREREEEEERERKAMLGLDTNRFEQRFAEMSDQDLLLLWLNFHIQRNVKRNNLDPALSRKYLIENFTTDTRDSIAFLVLCEEITPKPSLRSQLAEVREELDNDQRARLLLAVVHDFDPDASAVLSAEAIVHGNGADLCAAFVGKLFCHEFSIRTLGGGVEEMLSGLEELKREWEAMTTRVHKLKQKMSERELLYKRQRQQIYRDRKHQHQGDVDAQDDEQEDADDAAAAAAAGTAAQSPALPSSSLSAAAESASSADALQDSSAFPASSSQFDSLPPDDASQYTAYTQRFLASFLRLYRDSRFVLDRLRHGHEVWCQLQARISRFVLNVLVNRMQGKTLPMINYKERRDRDTFTTVDAARLSDVLSPQDDIELLQVELSAAYPDLRRIFRYYASNEWEGGSSCSWRDIQALLNDAKLTAGSGGGGGGGKAAAAGGLQGLKGGYEALFQQSAVMLERYRGADGEALPAGEEGLELTAAGFIQLLVRLAHHKYKNDAPAQPATAADAAATVSVSTSSSASSAGSISLGEKLSMLLRHYVLKHGRKLDTDSFRARYANAEFLDMLRKHKKKIRKTFDVCCLHRQDQQQQYASAAGSGSGSNAQSDAGSGGGEDADVSSGGFSVSVEVRELCSILKGVKVIGGEGGLTVDEFYALVGHCRKSDFCTSGGIIGCVENLRVEYGEFVELLVAVACYRYPDPYTPLAQRVDNFLAREMNIVFK